MTTANREYEALTTVEAVQHVETLQNLRDRIEMGGDISSRYKKARRLSALDAAIAALHAPAASVGDADSDAVALGEGDFYGNGANLPTLHDDPAINAEIVISALCARLDTARQALADAAAMQVVQPALVRIKQNAAWAMNETAPGRVLPRTYTAPPAAPVVSEGVRALVANWREQAEACDTAAQEGSGWSSIARADFADSADKFRRLADELEAALSVPATDDKAPAVDAEAVAWRYRVVTNSGARGEWFFSADETKTEGCIEAEPLYAAPTSPHDVDAVRVDEAMVERFKASFHESSVAHVPYDEALRAALTAALRKPGGA